MSKEKHRHKKKRHKNTTDEKDDQNERPNSSLFNEADAKSVEVSGYTVGHGAPQTSLVTQEKVIPTGVAVVDKSVKLPDTPPQSQHHDSRPDTTLQPSENYIKGRVHLPPISHQHHPHGYIYPSSDSHHLGHLSYPHQNYYGHPSPHQRHHHHHQHSQHRHHHHHQHHHHEKEVETYDPRWWYMPLHSVHRPKPWRPPEYHYSPPKWYESSSKQNKIWSNTPESKSPSHKYVDCRCEVCRPSKESSRGTKWVVNE